MGVSVFMCLRQESWAATDPVPFNGRLSTVPAHRARSKSAARRAAQPAAPPAAVSTPCPYTDVRDRPAPAPSSAQRRMPSRPPSSQSRQLYPWSSRDPHASSSGGSYPRQGSAADGDRPYQLQERPRPSAAPAAAAPAPSTASASAAPAAAAPAASAASASATTEAFRLREQVLRRRREEDPHLGVRVLLAVVWLVSSPCIGCWLVCELASLRWEGILRHTRQHLWVVRVAGGSFFGRVLCMRCVWGGERGGREGDLVV